MWPALRGLPGVPSHVARQPFLDPIGIAEEAHRAIRSEELDVGIGDQHHVVLRRLYRVGQHHVGRVPSLLAH
jgi:hypothetical protein